MPRGDGRFDISQREIVRRKAAFDRLAVATTASAALAVGDLLVRGLPESLAAIALLALVFLVARAGLAMAFGRFAGTAWTFSPGFMRRSDSRSDAGYPLESVTGVRTKRTTSGSIREIRVTLDDGRTVYVNGVDGMEALRARLLEGSPAGTPELEVREAVDYDASWFYVLLGAVLGVSVSLATRVALSPSWLDFRLAYAALAAYASGLGLYWLCATPLAGRFGPAAVSGDRVVGIVIIGVGVLSGGIALTGHI